MFPKSRQSHICVQGAEHHLFESSYNSAETEAQQGGAATLFHQTLTTTFFMNFYVGNTLFVHNRIFMSYELYIQ